jgi:hypothetical protein
MPLIVVDEKQYLGPQVSLFHRRTPSYHELEVAYLLAAGS